MTDTEKVTSHHLDSLLCLIKLKQNEFFQIHEKGNDRSHVYLFTYKSRGYNKIMNIVTEYGEENNKNVTQFWIALKKIMKENMERVEKELGMCNYLTITKYYLLIIKRIRKFILNDSPLKKYIEIQGIINKKFELGTNKSSSADCPTHSAGKNKINQSIFNSTKKKKSVSINNLMTSSIKQKITTKKPSQQPSNTTKRFKKKNQRDNKKFIETTARLNNKLFKDLHLADSLQKFDCNKTRKINSAIIYGDLMARNSTIKRNISKFQSDTINKSCNNRTQKVRYNNSSFINQQSMKDCFKTLRKTDNVMVKKKKLSQISTVIKLPAVEARKVKLLKRPLTAKQSCKEKEESKIMLPAIQKVKKTVLTLRGREFEAYAHSLSQI